MPFRHVVLLTLVPEVSLGQVEQIVAGLRELPAQIPELRSYVVGIDAGLTPGNATIAVVADTDDRAGWQTYRDHPAHQRVISELIAPVLASRVAVQHETDT